MQISPNGLRFLQSNEGFSATVYKDVAGVQTIGIGHKLLPGESFPDGITQDQAQTMLIHDLTFVQNALTVLAPASCTQNQWDALCDFGFNLGVGALKTLLAHGWDQVPTQMLRWRFARLNGVETEVPALKTRREDEISLFIS